MENIQWILSGIGTELLTLVIGALIGGFTGYKIGIKKKYKQEQKAGSDSKQKQEFIDKDIINTSSSKKSITSAKQTQKAGKNSEQSQVGRFSNGK